MQKTSHKMILENVRCSYVYVREPRKKEDGSDGKYGVQIILPKKSKQATEVKKAIIKVLAGAFGAEAAKKKGRFKLPLRDGDDEREGSEYEGMYFMNANAGKRPGLVNKKNKPADEDDIEDYCYSGAYFHTSINLYAFAAKDGGKPGVAVGLNNVMLHRKGDRLDGASNAADDFADYASDGADDDDDFDDDDEW